MVIALMADTPSKESAAEILKKRTPPCLVVLDRDYRIVIAEPRLAAFLAGAGIEAEAPDRLPATIENAVRHLAGPALNGGAPLADTAVPVPGVIIRTSVLTGPSGACVAVSLERLRSRDPIRAAARRYGLTNREVEVLNLILEGLEARDISARLHIAESTVGEYFKHLYAKIGAKNRSAMLARVFEWPHVLS